MTGSREFSSMGHRLAGGRSLVVYGTSGLSFGSLAVYYLHT